MQRSDEAVATAVPRLDEARAPGVIVERAPELLNARGERGVAHDRIAPHGTEELAPRDQLAGTPDQRRQHGCRPGSELHLALTGPEATTPRIESVATEPDLLAHRRFPVSRAPDVFPEESHCSLGTSEVTSSYAPTNRFDDTHQ